MPAEIDVADAALRRALRILGVDVKLDPVGDGIQPLEIPEEFPEVLLDVPAFGVPLPDRIGLVPEHHVPEFPAADLAAPPRPPPRGLIVPDIADRRGVEDCREARCGKGDVELNGLVIRRGIPDIAAPRQPDGLPLPVQKRKLPEIDVELPLDPEGGVPVTDEADDERIPRLFQTEVRRPRLAVEDPARRDPPDEFGGGKVHRLDRPAFRGRSRRCRAEYR